MSNRTKNFLQGLLFAVLTSAIAIIAHNISDDGSILQRIAILLGGDLPGGIIQFVILLAFFWCIFELQSLSRLNSLEDSAFAHLNHLKTLPSLNDEHKVLSPDDISEMKHEVINFHEQHGQEYLIMNLIKKACTRFRADKSISDVLNVVSEQTRINFARAESSQSLIRFLAWSLPSIGFIGTIMGIAGALGFANEASTEEGLTKITDALYLAFDTTLLALFLSIIIMWLYHNLQEKEEKLHSKIEEYVIENLINRIVLR